MRMSAPSAALRGQMLVQFKWFLKWWQTPMHKTKSAKSKAKSAPNAKAMAKSKATAKDKALTVTSQDAQQQPLHSCRSGNRQ